MGCFLWENSHIRWWCSLFCFVISLLYYYIMIITELKHKVTPRALALRESEIFIFVF